MSSRQISIIFSLALVLRGKKNKKPASNFLTSYTNVTFRNLYNGIFKVLSGYHLFTSCLYFRTIDPDHSFFCLICFTRRRWRLWPSFLSADVILVGNIFSLPVFLTFVFTCPTSSPDLWIFLLYISPGALNVF